MGKASSSKKVARAARAGGSRRVGQRRNLGFPAVITFIVVAGVALVIFARNDREATAAPRPAQNGQEGDHWHAAYAINLCGEIQAPLEDGPAGDQSGIHSHADGVIHIHPFARSFAGDNADLGLFADTVAMELHDDRIVLPDGTTKTEGEDKCDGDDARLAVAVWSSAEAAAEGEKPNEIVTDDFGDIRFRDDREAYTIAFLPEDEEIPAPESIPTLDNLSDVPGATTTTEPGDTSSTTAPGGGSSTTAPGGGSSTTAPGGAPTTTATVPGGGSPSTSTGEPGTTSTTAQ